MKTKTITGGILILFTTLALAATNDLTSALQKGLFEEEANHNLEAAAQAYQAVSTQFDKDRKLAATAIFRLGEVYRKQGKTNEAVAQYERIVREFSDQATLATLSRQNLAGLNAGAENASLSPRGQIGGANDLGEQEALLAQKSALLERLKQLDQDTLRQVLPTIINDPVLQEASKQLNSAQQKLVAIKKDYHSDHPVYIREQAAIETALKQVQDLCTANLKSLAIQVASLKEALEAAKSGRGIGATTNTSTDDEEKEIRRIQEVIRNSPDLINAPTLGASGNVTPLCQAASAGWLRVAIFLLDAGAVIDRPSNNSTALHLAAASGHKAMIELLTKRGANLNAHDGTGATPLHIAAERGFLSVAESLIQLKADLNSRNSKANGEQTPLHRAAAQGHPALVAFLISKGAELDASSGRGSTPLALAAVFGHTEVITVLLKAGAKVDATDERGATALASAAGRGHLDAVKALLAGNADPNGGKSGAALFGAINNPTVMELLLNAGAKPNVTNELGETPLMVTILRGDERILGLLVKNGADVNAKNNRGMTPLQMAVWSESLPMVSLLLTNNADVNATGPAGRNALLMAQEAIGGSRPFTPGDYGGNGRGTDAAKARKIAELMRQHGAKEPSPGKP